MGDVSRMTYDAEFLRELNISRQVRVLLFNKRGKVLLAAYSLTPDPAKLQLPLNLPEAAVTEVCGKRSIVPLKDGILALTLTEGAGLHRRRRSRLLQHRPFHGCIRARKPDRQRRSSGDRESHAARGAGRRQCEAACSGRRIRHACRHRLGPELAGDRQP